MRLLSQEATQSDAKPQDTSPLINRRDLLRAALFASAASALGPAFSFAQAVDAGLTPAARGEDGAAFLTDPNWKTAFLNDQQNETLIALSEVIIPATDSPGAKEALVNRYIDLLLSVQPAEFQQQFVEALSFMDSAGQEQYGKDFRSLSPDDKIWLLTPWAYPRKPSHWGGEQELKPDPAQKHFGRLKALIAAAYYSSEIGQKELGWGESSDHDLYNDCGRATTAPKPTHITTHKPTHK
jgi:glucoside 3-dehydrogenase (cytochrome c) hitch-hiker subunit